MIAAHPPLDDALRQLGAPDLLALCRWLGIPADPGAIRLGEALPATTRSTDLLVGCGPGLVAQLEVVHEPDEDLPWRLLEYRARLHRREPGVRLSQHVLVLGGGSAPGILDDGAEVWARFHVTHLREQDPADLLADPALAPWACLARVPDDDSRREVLREALKRITTVAPERIRGLTALALVLAAVHLDPDTIELARRETAVPISLEGTVGGRILERRAMERGRAEGQVTAVSRILISRFGADERIDAIALDAVTRHAERAVDLALAITSLDAVDPSV